MYIFTYVHVCIYRRTWDHHGCAAEQRMMCVCVCVYIYIYMYVYIHMHVYTGQNGNIMDALWNRRRYVCVCVCVHINIHVYVYIHVCIYRRKWEHHGTSWICFGTEDNVCLCVCVCVYTCTYMCI